MVRDRVIIDLDSAPCRRKPHEDGMSGTLPRQVQEGSSNPSEIPSEAISASLIFAKKKFSNRAETLPHHWLIWPYVAGITSEVRRPGGLFGIWGSRGFEWRTPLTLQAARWRL